MKRRMLKTVLATCCLAIVGAVHAAEPFKIGLIVPMTGPFASTGKQIDLAARLYMQEHGDEVAGRKIQLILKDDGGIQPEVTKRIAQELIVQEKVDVLAGFGLTPLAFATAPIATRAKVPMVVMAAATSSLVQKSPYIVRVAQTLPQVTAPLAQWALSDEANIKSVVTLVADYGPGHDTEKVFTKHFTEGGGKILDSLRIPLQNPDFAPFLQRVKDQKPDALFVFVPSGPGSTLLKQYASRGLADEGIRLIGSGILDDDQLPNAGPEALGMITALHYSAAHDSPENKAYVQAFRKFSGENLRPDYMSVGGWDGLHLIYEALRKAGPDANGDQLLAAMKGMSWTSPRGPVAIDPETRDIVQNVYIRRAEMVDGEIYNIEFKTIENVKDPGL